MAIHYSVLAWEVPWTEEPGGLHSMGSQRVGHDWATDWSTHTRVVHVESAVCPLRRIILFEPHNRPLGKHHFSSDYIKYLSTCSVSTLSFSFYIEAYLTSDKRHKSPLVTPASCDSFTHRVTARYKQTQNISITPEHSLTFLSNFPLPPATTFWFLSLRLLFFWYVSFISCQWNHTVYAWIIHAVYIRRVYICIANSIHCINTSQFAFEIIFW